MLKPVIKLDVAYIVGEQLLICSNKQNMTKNSGSKVFEIIDDYSHLFCMKMEYASYVQLWEFFHVHLRQWEKETI